MHSFIVFLFIVTWTTSAQWVKASENKSELEDHIHIVTRNAPNSDKAKLAEDSIHILNSTMQGIYEKNLTLFQDNLLKSNPVILALFNSEGGSLTLYRPGKEPLQASPVNGVYVLVKSVGHSAMATYQLIVPYINYPKNQLWRGPTQDFLLKNQIALKSLDDLKVSAEIKKTMRSILQENSAQMDKWLKDGTPTLEELTTFTRKQAPYLEKCIGYATEAQVSHWLAVLNDWKKMLGSEWDRVYAASNTRYVTRRRNILFTTLAQFMGEKAINDRLLLFGTTDFGTEPKVMLSELTRVVSDRAIGELFFADKMAMDVELLGRDAFSKLKEKEKDLPNGAHLPRLDETNSKNYPF